jgi:hypothetical protein
MEYNEENGSRQRQKPMICADFKNSRLWNGQDSELHHVGGLRSLLALGDIETDPLILREGPESPVLDGGVVDEQVGATLIRRNETETLFCVEPLNSSLSHSNFLGE